MAEHADSSGAIVEVSAFAGSATATDPPVRPLRSATRPALAIGITVVAALGAVTGWFEHRNQQAHEAQTQRTEYVQVARQAALDLTTVRFAEAESDVQRILDSATGAFRDDFQRRSQPFIDAVKQARSSSRGTVTEAGLISESGEKAQALVIVSMETSTAAAPEQPTRGWRLRISLENVDDTPKVSNVEFLP
jgi:Mce-associated membrane protein